LWADFSEASCEGEVLAAKRIKSKTWSAILRDELAYQECGCHLNYNIGTRKNNLYCDQDNTVSGCSCSCPLTGDFISICGRVINSVSL